METWIHGAIFFLHGLLIGYEISHFHWHKRVKNNQQGSDAMPQPDKVVREGIRPVVENETLRSRVKRKVTKPKGAVIRTPDEEAEISETKRKKRLFLARAEKNPLAPLPDGLNPEDFGLDPMEEV